MKTKFDVLVLVKTHHKHINDVACLCLLGNNYYTVDTGRETDDTYGGIGEQCIFNIQGIGVSEGMHARLSNESR